MNAAERLFTSNVVHQNEAHRSSVVSCGDGPIPLLTRCILKQKIFVKNCVNHSNLFIKSLNFLHQILLFIFMILTLDTHPYLKLHSLVLSEDCFNFEIWIQDCDWSVHYKYWVLIGRYLCPLCWQMLMWMNRLRSGRGRMFCPQNCCRWWVVWTCSQNSDLRHLSAKLVLLRPSEKYLLISTQKYLVISTQKYLVILTQKYFSQWNLINQIKYNV